MKAGKGTERKDFLKEISDFRFFVALWAAKIAGIGLPAIRSGTGHWRLAGHRASAKHHASMPDFFSCYSR
jgi:hypothetical protein